MNVIIIGCGKVGSKLAEVLSTDGNDVVIVDNDRRAFGMLPPDFNGITVAGVPIDQDVLKQAGIETTDALAAVTPDDNVNIMTCQVAKEIFKVPKVIARIYNPDREHVFHEFGLDTICPTNITVDVLKSMILSGRSVSTHTIGTSKVTFRYESIFKGDEGKKLSQARLPEDTFPFGIQRDGRLVFADPELVLRSEDLLVLAQMTG